MMTILDATAGNRTMWGDNKFPEGVVFLDKEPRLMIKPDVLTTWDKIPYPNDYFTCAIFDPPHTWFGESSIHNNPVRIDGKRGATWWGNPGNELNLVRDIIKGQHELARVSPVLCFKWNETSIGLEKILTCFLDWREVFRMEYKSTRKTGTSKTWLVRLHRRTQLASKSELTVGNERGASSDSDSRNPTATGNKE